MGVRSLDAGLMVDFTVTLTRSHGKRPPCEGAVYKDKKWHINISTLDELLTFVDTNGDIIIFPDNSIEIYNDYRE